MQNSSPLLCAFHTQALAPLQGATQQGVAFDVPEMAHSSSLHASFERQLLFRRRAEAEASWRGNGFTRRKNRNAADPAAPTLLPKQSLVMLSSGNGGVSMSGWTRLTVEEKPLQTERKGRVLSSATSSLSTKVITPSPRQQRERVSTGPEGKLPLHHGFAEARDRVNCAIRDHAPELTSAGQFSAIQVTATRPSASSIEGIRLACPLVASPLSDGPLSSVSSEYLESYRSFDGVHKLAEEALSAEPRLSAPFRLMRSVRRLLSITGLLKKPSMMEEIRFDSCRNVDPFVDIVPQLQTSAGPKSISDSHTTADSKGRVLEERTAICMMTLAAGPKRSSDLRRAPSFVVTASRPPSRPLSLQTTLRRRPITAPVGTRTPQALGQRRPWTPESMSKP